MEEDIVYFADTYIDPLHGHPLLSDRRTLKEIHNARAFSYSDTEFENFYDEALKTEFVRRINELILGIPTMSDAEIFIGLAETAFTSRSYIFPSLSVKVKTAVFSLPITPMCLSTSQFISIL